MREYPRIVINEPAVLYLHTIDGTKEVYCIIRDISHTGLAIIIEGPNLVEQAEAKIHFILENVKGMQQIFTEDLRIIRSSNPVENVTVYGCMFKNPSNELNTSIRILEAINLSKIIQVPKTLLYKL